MGLDRKRDGWGRRVTTVGTFVAHYSLVVVFLVWIADVFVKWSVPHLIELLLMLILPAFASGFLIYESLHDRRKINTWLFLAAAEAHLGFIAFVLVYEAFQLNDVVSQSCIDEIVVGVVAVSLVVAVALYKRIKGRVRELEMRCRDEPLEATR